jgi:hypothetical protein
MPPESGVASSPSTLGFALRVSHTCFHFSQVWIFVEQCMKDNSFSLFSSQNICRALMAMKNNHLYPCLKPDISQVIDEISLSLMRVNSTNVLDEGLRIEGRRRRMNSNVKVSRNKCISKVNVGVQPGLLSICPTPSPPGPYI